MALTLADLLASPDHYLHSFEDEAAVFVPMSRAAYHRSIFLDARISPEREGAARIPLAAFAGHVPDPKRTCWIFHVAHCGSTLLARALDQPATNLVLREPLALRQAALPPDPGPDPGRLTLLAAMLSKRYHGELPTIVKANVPVNFLLPRLGALDPTAPAIFLYLELEDYLLAILRSSDHRAWLRRVTHQLAGHLGNLADLSDAERAAALWLAQIRAYADALTMLPQARSLDAERFFADPQVALRAAAAHFYVPLDATTVRSITQGPLFASYSKNPAQAFDNAARLARRQALMPSLGRELGQARAWLEHHGTDAASALEKLKGAALLA
jgi:hypothetical protein